MRSYLSLIPISAKVHRRQNHMTLLCILFAVFLVTAIFSMADMLIRSETMHAKEVHGNWHIQIHDLTESEASAIAARDDVAAASWYDVTALDKDSPYQIGGKQAVLCGIDEAFRTNIMRYFPAGSSVATDDEAILTPNAQSLLGVAAGDTITLDTPAGSYSFRVTGFRSDDSQFASNNGTGETTALLVDDDQIGVFMSITAFRQILSANGETGSPVFYVQFDSHANIGKAIREIGTQYGLTDADIEQNFILMGLAGLSNNTMIKNVYPLVFILFLLILLAGVLMISGSLNSTVAQRTQFFGMMRCIGMSKQQVVRFVRLEALNWCKTAIPLGVLLGTCLAWGLNAVLRYLVSGEFRDIPVFGVSAVGMVSGALLGLLTVWLAAQAPAKRAARVSPMAAVSGNDSLRPTRPHHLHTRLLPIECSLGVSHAAAARKNLVLLSGSFALSIVLFLCFSVLVELLGCLLPASLSAPNLSIASEDNTNTVCHALVAEIQTMPGVKHAFGRMYQPDVPAAFSAETDETTVDLISYDDLQLGWLADDDMLRPGSDLSNVYGDNGSVLAIWDEAVPLDTGDTVSIGGTTLQIAGMLKYSPFSNSGRTDGEVILICSEPTFTRLTGMQDYAIIDVQVGKETTDAQVAAIQSLAGDDYTFIDRRDEGDRSTFYAFSLFIYGFLVIIALITVLNIINSISMSVSARTRQYGAMRAVGMDGRQLTRMIAAEAATYALTGCILGCAAGLPLHRLLYDRLVTAHFPYFTWTMPFAALVVILLFVLGATVLAVYAPAKRMRRISVTETINEL
nr:ABC transporter permease [uncultured Agathobaculum sp.]